MNDNGTAKYTINHLDTVLKVIATIIAVFGVWQYFADNHRSRITETKKEALSLVSEWSSPNLIRNREALANYWESQPAFSQYIRNTDAITENEYTNFIYRTVPQHPDFIVISNALFQINDYFDRAYCCRKAKICDAEILDQFLCERSLVLNRVYGPFMDLKNLRIGSVSYGSSLEAYFASCNDR